MVGAVANADQIGTADRKPVGEYIGHAFNTTANQRGDVVFDLFALDPSTGRLRAYFAASNGLEGDAWLSGRIGRDGTLQLEGPLATFAMKVDGRVQNGSIHAAYVLEGTKPQKGTFDVAYRRALPFADSRITGSHPELIGAWEMGGGMPAQIDPVTGEASGVSFVEARHLDVLPDGTFKHLRTHRNCQGRGISRCCTEEAFLEKGPLTFEGDRVRFETRDGGTIVRYGCSGGGTRQEAVQKGTFDYNWSLRSGPNGIPELCVQGKKGGPTCYQKQG